MKRHRNTSHSHKHVLWNCENFRVSEIGWHWFHSCSKT